jgi:hypothetical protein
LPWESFLVSLDVAEDRTVAGAADARGSGPGSKGDGHRATGFGLYGDAVP